MSRSVGIDLGTTNSCVSTLEGGDPVVIANSEGVRTTPSVVAFSKEGGETLIGDVAKRQMVTNIDGTVSSVKRHMGTTWTTEINGKSYTAPEISARILQKLKKDAETFLNEEIESAVITVPAYFNDAERQATKDAGEIAGLKVERIVNEPTAAALAYGLDRGKDNERILVYDLGGGTFDVSLLEVGKEDDGFSTIQVLATSGDNKLGGDDWNNAIVDWLMEQIKSNGGPDLSGDKTAQARLLEAAEIAKKELSSAPSANISLQYLTVTPEGPVHVDEKLSIATFEDITSDLLDRTRKPFQDVLDQAGVTVDDINHVLLVGGSTRMTQVSELVEELTGKKPNQGVNPDEVVAMGAALQSGVVKGEKHGVLLIDVTPLSIGIANARGEMVPIIERNTAIPTTNSKTFTTSVDNQENVYLPIYQGERHMAEDNKHLGELVMEDIVPAPAGVPQIEVSFNLDANGMIQVTAKDLATKTETTVHITGETSLSSAEIQRMISDAEANAEEDRKRKEVSELKGNAERSVYSAEKLLKKYDEQIPADVKTEVKEDVKKVNDALGASDMDALKSALGKLASSQSKIGQSLYGSK